MSLPRPPRAKDLARKKANGEISDSEKEGTQSSLEGAETIGTDGADDGMTGSLQYEAVGGAESCTRGGAQGIPNGAGATNNDMGRAKRNNADESSCQAMLPKNDSVVVAHSVAENEDKGNIKNGATSNLNDGFRIAIKDEADLVETDSSQSSSGCKSERNVMSTSESEENFEAEIGAKFRPAKPASARSGNDSSKNIAKSFQTGNERFTRFGAAIKSFDVEESNKRNKRGGEGEFRADNETKDLTKAMSENMKTKGKHQVDNKTARVPSSRTIHCTAEDSETSRTDTQYIGKEMPTNFTHHNILEDKEFSNDTAFEDGELQMYNEEGTGVDSRENDMMSPTFLKTSSDRDHEKNSSFYKEQEDLVISCPNPEDESIFYYCPPENFFPAKVMFQVGGDEDEDWQYRRDHNDGISTPSRPQDMFLRRGSDVSSAGSMDRGKTGYNGSLSASNIGSSTKVLGRKRVSIELPRGIFIDQNKVRQQEAVTKPRKRVSIEEPQAITFGEMARPGSHSNLYNSWGMNAAGNTSADYIANNGILKHSASAPRQYSRESQDNKDVSDGLGKVRRRSQLTLSPDIPVDVPLKHRQMENEARNKNNLEFIKRRVSLQEEKKLPKSPSVELSFGDGRESDLTTSTSLNLSSPGYFTHTANDRSPKSALAKNEDTHPHVARSPAKELVNTRHSRVVIEREVDEAEIVDYLGNIHPERRRYGFPPSPRGHLHGPASSPSQASGRSVERDVNGPGNVIYDNRAFDNYDDDDNVFVRNGVICDEDHTMQPYIPIRRQKISFQDGAQAAQIWTVKGHDNQAYQAFPERVEPPRKPLLKTLSLDSFASGSASTVELTDQRFSPCRIRKDSLAIFNSKLTGSGRGRLRRLSQVSLEQIQQAAKKNLSQPSASSSSPFLSSPSR
ncbi:hypothetical protein ElyMa_001464800 [Elysia marginata]|uniref:Uncharacterized protein n=1 Tax=Elysia marginata TaxID=1093978 RepID=A0AAV4J3T6_9GAST|nr:hypothetical protein ElyMa_001464800 [Elysia marginata]